MKPQTQLLSSLFNPYIFDAINQPKALVQASFTTSFVMQRGGFDFDVTFFEGEEGRVIIYKTSHESFHSEVITDYCKTVEDFVVLIEKLDDLIIRMPKKTLK